ncbi:MAG: hypothetical protein KHX13_04845 [Acidaminococcus intestini]|uniref:5'-3' exonuclease n=1 Tax=Acidaminococcus intestini TaxID=187327 RepID=A0A943EKI8_9FIRM|nr:hypothetical protein [Acidaminococcus intestini]
MIHVLLDGDMFVFRACASCEREIDWGNNIWTLHVDIEEARNKFLDLVEDAIERAFEKMQYDGGFDVTLCFSSDTNFRKKVLPTYKANRDDKRKPVAYKAVVDWVKKVFRTKEIEGLEADDCLGILATSHKTKCIIISGDKDMKTIPCLHFDFLRGSFFETTPEESTYWFYMQTLMGDATDGYSGCPKVGQVTAKKLLDANCSWATVVKAFEAKGLSEEYALQQARVAKILLASDYDERNRKVILWKPHS